MFLGLTIVVENINRMRYMSHFRSVHRGSFFQEMRTTEARQLLPDAWGFICPVHTPDGTPCGLLNHLSKNCEVCGYKMQSHHLFVIPLFFSNCVWFFPSGYCKPRSCSCEEYSSGSLQPWNAPPQLAIGSSNCFDGMFCCDA